MSARGQSEGLLIQCCTLAALVIVATFVCDAYQTDKYLIIAAGSLLLTHNVQHTCTTSIYMYVQFVTGKNVHVMNDFLL